MSLDRSLLIRRWPERRPVVLAAAAAGFASVLALTRAADDPQAAIELLHLLPVMLVALELGLAGGLAAAVLAVGLLLGGDAAGSEQLDAVGIATRTLAYTAAALIAGRFSDRMRAAQARERRLLDSGLALSRARDIHDLAPTVTSAACRTPGVAGAEIELEAADGAKSGRPGRRHTEFVISVRGKGLGRLTVRHDAPLEPEDRAALELLAQQAGLAAENQRLLVHRREAAALEQQLLRVRDELLEQRSGLNQLLEAQEDERGRAAERLREELAQMLAAVLLGLRTLRRTGADPTAGSVDELHSQVVAVLSDIRAVAGALRPSTLAHMGLVPALRTLAEDLREEDTRRLHVAAAGEADALTQPHRTAVYRVVEHLVESSPPSALIQVRVGTPGDAVELSIVLPADQPTDSVRAARARIAALGGAFSVTPAIDDLTHVHIRLPVARDGHAGSSPSSGSAPRRASSRHADAGSLIS